MVERILPAILYSDDYILAINKPSGLLCLPDGYKPEIPHLKSILEPEYGRLWIVHRLDKETSGVLVLARSAHSHKILNQQFQDRLVKKEYHAIIQGNPAWDIIRIETLLKVDGDRRHRTTIDPLSGKPAATNCTVLLHFAHTALISAHPESGYTHQIRAQLASLGFPILSDPLYGAPLPSQVDIFQRTALHSRQINFLHPYSSLEMVVQAPYPIDFEDYLKQNQPAD
jgi:tRNA pseudouridine32 synthase / 23S rRNA pseudouridine746 synthase